MTDVVPVAGPAPIVPVEQRDVLVDQLVASLVAEVGADPTRDADKLDLAVRSSVGEVEVHLDVDGSATDPPTPIYPDIPSIDPRVRKAMLDLAAGELRRPGFAYGLAGYDEADPMATRARGAILAGMTPGLKRRWGVA